MLQNVNFNRLSRRFIVFFIEIFILPFNEIKSNRQKNDDLKLTICLHLATLS